MDATGMWFLDQEVEMDTENYQDMRRFGSWVPPDSVLNVNGTTSGCLEMTKSGLLNVKLDGDCETARKPACEYTGNFFIVIYLSILSNGKE